MAVDRYAGSASIPESPASEAAAVTPDDDNDLGFVTRGLYIGGAGDVAVVMDGGEEVTFVGMLAGAVYPLRVQRVLETGTTVGLNIVALW